MAGLDPNRESKRVAVQQFLLGVARVVSVEARLLHRHLLQLGHGILRRLARQVHTQVERRTRRCRVVPDLANTAVLAEVNTFKARRAPPDQQVKVLGDRTLHARLVASMLDRGGAEGGARQLLIIAPDAVGHMAVAGRVYVKEVGAEQVRGLVRIDRDELGTVPRKSRHK